eukprot:6212491-Pleurochrysis_carterae.AAC.1
MEMHVSFVSHTPPSMSTTPTSIATIASSSRKILGLAAAPRLFDFAPHSVRGASGFHGSADAEHAAHGGVRGRANR